MSEAVLTETAYSNLLETLAYLASFKVQEKYIIGGTKEEYVVPDDLLDDYLSDVEFFKFEKFPNRIAWLKAKAGEKALDSIEELYSDIKASGSFLEKYTHANIAELINADPVWIKLRDSSGKILNMCGFDLGSWEKEIA
jgi:hypothetical protein